MLIEVFVWGYLIFCFMALALGFFKDSMAFEFEKIRMQQEPVERTAPPIVTEEKPDVPDTNPYEGGADRFEESKKWARAWEIHGRGDDSRFPEWRAWMIKQGIDVNDLIDREIPDEKSLSGRNI